MKIKLYILIILGLWFTVLSPVYSSDNKAKIVKSRSDTLQNGMLALNSAYDKDSSRKKESPVDTTTGKNLSKCRHGNGNFVDNNNDGLNDNCRNCKGKDRFVDKDGDGINDNRCKGSGFCRQKNKKKCCPRGK